MIMTSGTISTKIMARIFENIDIRKDSGLPLDHAKQSDVTLAGGRRGGRAMSAHASFQVRHQRARLRIVLRHIRTVGC